jgi:hypothetical protein
MFTPPTTDTAAGLLVLITTFLVDQVVRHRQSRNPSNAVAAQAAIMQAIRASQEVFQLLADSGDLDMRS